MDRQPIKVPAPEDLDKRDKQHIRLTYITHFYFNQRTASAIIDLLRKYERYRPQLLSVIQFVVVDDGSPLEFDIPEFRLNLIWLRIDKDIPWNQGGARNLGAVFAKSDKMILTDLDHEFPEETLEYAVRMGDLRNKMYKIHTRDPESGQTYRGHPNIFLMSRGRFLRLWGYDEEFSGGHGGEDFRFVKYQKYHGTWFRHLPKRYVCVRRNDIDRGSEYHSLIRDQSRNSKIDPLKKAQIIYWGKEAGHSRIFLDFPWHRVVEYSLPRPAAVQHRRLWKKFWLIRTLLGGDP